MIGAFKWLIAAAIPVSFGCISNEPAIVTQASIAVERAVRAAQLEHRLPGITHASKEFPDKCSGDATIHRIDLVNVGNGQSTGEANQAGRLFASFRILGTCLASGERKDFQADLEAILIKNNYGQIESATIRVARVNM